MSVRCSYPIWESEELRFRSECERSKAELFLLSATSVELDFEDGHQFERLYGERIHLAGELLLNRNEHLPRSVEDPGEGTRRNAMGLDV